MKIWSNSFQDGGRIPEKFAFCAIDPQTHVRMSENKNPHLAWSEVPVGTRSLVCICHDPDVPSVGTDVNQEGRTIPASLPRVDFFHWTLIDIPPTIQGFEEGQLSEGVVAHGKPGPAILLQGHQLRQGINDYTPWFAGDAEMEGDYFGYDGPCPPWNDSLVHHYVFTLYALDIPKLALEGKFDGQQVRQAIYGHILDEARVIGEYSLNPLI